jgi:hypothetical protein
MFEDNMKAPEDRVSWISRRKRHTTYFTEAKDDREKILHRDGRAQEQRADGGV